MEAHITSGIEDHLIDGLQFKAGSGTAAYVLNSRFVRYFAESGNRFDSNSSRVIRFRLADHCFLEPASCRLQMTIQNLTVDGGGNNVALTPIAQPLSMFRRARLFMASQLVEDWVELGTTAVLLERMKPVNRRGNDSLEGHILTGSADSDTFSPIPAGGARKVLMQLPFGCLNQPRWLPLHLIAGGLIMELELGDAADAFNEAAAAFQLEGVSLHATCHEVDSALANSYAQHVLKGSPLHLPYQSLVVTKHIVTQATFTLNLVRGFTRLKQIYVTFHKNGDKPIRDFHHPIGNNVVSTANDTLTYQLQIGSRKWPERAVGSLAEAFMRFRQSAGVFYGSDDISIAAADFHNKKAVYSIDLEKVGNQALYSGYSTKDGSIVTLDFANTGMGAANDYALVYMVFDGIVSIRDGTVDVLE